MSKKTLFSWSSGKDSAWALYKLQEDPEIEVVGLFCVVNQEFERVAMHAVRTELLQQQAASIGLPIEIIYIPNLCDYKEYEEIMLNFIKKSMMNKIEYFAYGDIFLEDVKQSREKLLANSSITPIFPLWNIPTRDLSQQMIEGGLKAILTCIDPNLIDKEFIGKDYAEFFISNIPQGVDPCGENGEFHSFVYDAPIFKFKINVTAGEIVNRSGFYFIDLLAEK